MDPITTGALIQTGGQIAGGLISKGSQKKAAKKAYKRQKEFAQNAIQWKVKDAKAAGLHPLYALGGGSSSYQPSFIAGQDPMGSALASSSETLGAAYTQSQAPPPGTPQGAMGTAQLRAINASADRDEAAAIRDLSAAKRMEGQVNFSQDSPPYSGGALPLNPMKPASQSRVGGSNIKTNRDFSDAEEIENRYGDVASWLYGLGVIGADGYSTVKQALETGAKSARLPKRRIRQSSKPSHSRRQRRQRQYGR